MVDNLVHFVFAVLYRLCLGPRECSEAVLVRFVPGTLLSVVTAWKIARRNVGVALVVHAEVRKGSSEHRALAVDALY